jgi:hypothetical protein
MTPPTDYGFKWKPNAGKGEPRNKERQVYLRFRHGGVYLQQGAPEKVKAGQWRWKHRGDDDPFDITWFAEG